MAAIKSRPPAPAEMMVRAESLARQVFEDANAMYQTAQQQQIGQVAMAFARIMDSMKELAEVIKPLDAVLAGLSSAEYSAMLGIAHNPAGKVVADVRNIDGAVPAAPKLIATEK